MTVADLLVTSIAGGIAAPAGFRAAGVACGIKKAGLDLALVATDAPVPAAAVSVSYTHLTLPTIYSV